MWQNNKKNRSPILAFVEMREKHSPNTEQEQKK